MKRKSRPVWIRQFNQSIMKLVAYGQMSYSEAVRERGHMSRLMNNRKKVKT